MWLSLLWKLVGRRLAVDDDWGTWPRDIASQSKEFLAKRMVSQAYAKSLASITTCFSRRLRLKRRLIAVTPATRFLQTQLWPFSPPPLLPQTHPWLGRRCWKRNPVIPVQFTFSALKLASSLFSDVRAVAPVRERDPYSCSRHSPKVLTVFTETMEETTSHEANR